VRTASNACTGRVRIKHEDQGPGGVEVMVRVPSFVFQSFPVRPFPIKSFPIKSFLIKSRRGDSCTQQNTPSRSNLLRRYARSSWTMNRSPHQHLGDAEP